GQAVAFVGRPWMVPKIEEAGLAAFAAGSDRGLTPVRRPLRELDVEHEEQAFGRGFAQRIPQGRASEIVDLCRNWRPDLVVWEETDFGAAIAAEGLGLPHACVLVSAAGSFVRPDLVAEPLGALRAEHG